MSEEKVIVAVAATAAALSPRLRTAARKGAVYGLAGALKTGDVVAAAARGAARAGTPQATTPQGSKPSPRESAPS